MMMSDLPPNVTEIRDRHGKTRYRFRRRGWKSAYLPGHPGDAEFHRTYAEIIEKGADEPQPIASPRAPKPVSYTHLTLPTIYSV